MNLIVEYLINENLSNKFTTLDLGNCGLTSIPDEVLNLTHLEELNIGPNYYDSHTKEWKVSKNNGRINQISSDNLEKLYILPNLKTLYANKNKINNISFLNKFENIKNIYLDDNKISNFNELEKKKHLNILYLNNNLLESISGINKFPNLTDLELRNNGIEKIDSLKSLTSLKSLNISKNKISNLSTLAFFYHINDLDISENPIKSLKFLKNYNYLKKLNISYTRLDDISHISTLHNIEHLDCSRLKCTNFTAIGTLKNLRELIIHNNAVNNISFIDSYNSIEKIDALGTNFSSFSFVENLINLIELDLRFSNITEINFHTKTKKLKKLLISHSNNFRNYDSLFELTSLEQLHISSIKINDISNIIKLKNLIDLDLNGNNIIDISPLASCIKLKKLNISFNKIIEIESIKHLQQLEKLDLAYNPITKLNPILELKNLKNLDLAGYKDVEHLFTSKTLNNLENLDLANCDLRQCSFLKKLKKLKILDLDGNSINDISFLNELKEIKSLSLVNNPISNYEYLTNLPKLYNLNLSNCHFQNLNFFDGLTNLSILDLNSTGLVNIEFLSKYTNLTSLELSGNYIEDISPLENLSDLNTIDLKNNHIRKIPYQFFENIPLEWVIDKDDFYDFNKVNISQNNLEYPPLEVIKQGRDFIKEFYNNSESKNLNECKVILVGRGKVGKTSLQKRLTGEKFLKNEPETHGIRKVSWENADKNNVDNIKINIWDFGGQYIQQTLHQFFYSANTIYILVLDKRIDEDPEDFLELIKVYSKNSPVIILYNNLINLDDQIEHLSYNLHPEIDSSLRNKYPNIYPISFGVCCGLDNDIGINNLRNNLLNLIPTLDHVTKKYPATWIDIKNDIVKLVEKNYIPFSEFETICKSRNINKFSLQEDLANMLNDIGTITFFNKQFLGNYYILNPDWVSAGAYQIILSTHTNTKKGHITFNDLDIIFSVPLAYNYKHTDYRFILQLMTEFDLCHKFSKDEWLIPSSLEGQSNTDLTEYKAENYRLYFLNYEISLPSSIIHRFIARNVNYAFSNDYWRNGILVKHPDSLSYIYVEADRKDRQIRLWITGERIRDCWEFFRKDFREFSEDFSYNEYVSLDKKNEFKVSYKDLLACIDANELEWFIPNFGKIDVYETLGLFTDLKNLEQMNKNDKFQNKTENHFHAPLHVNGSIGNFASTSNNNDVIINSSDKSQIPTKDSEKENLRNLFRDDQLKKWRGRGWIYLFIFLFATTIPILILLYKVDWSLDINSEKWKAITNNGIYVIATAIIAMLLNGLFIKLLYDRYQSHSNIKAYIDKIVYPKYLN